MKIRILKTENNPSIEGLELNLPEFKNDGSMPYAELENGSIIVDQSYAIACEKPACFVGGEPVYNKRVINSHILYGSNPKNLTLITQFCIL